MESKFTLMYADTPSTTGIVYPREALQEAIAKAPKELRGQVGMPVTGYVVLEKVSHVVSDLELQEDGSVVGTVKFLQTPCGIIAQKILENSVIRPAMTGTLSAEAGIKTMTNVSFISFNLVNADDDTWPDRS